MVFGPSTTIRLTRGDPVQGIVYGFLAMLNLAAFPRHL